MIAKKRFGNHLKLLVLISFFLLLPAFSTTAFAKSFSFTSVNVDLHVNPDGSIDLIENRTFDFEGDFSWATYEVFIKGATDITSFEVLENGQPFQQSPAGTAGTVNIAKSPNAIKAQWYFNASDQQRTFTFKYRALDAVKVFTDVAEVNWKVIGAGWDESARNVKATVHLPVGAEKSQIKAWGHGPLNGNVSIVNGNTIDYTVSGLPSHTFVETRVTFPPALVPQASRRVSNDRLPTILSEEKEWANQANAKRRLARAGNAFGVILPFLTLTAGFVLWLIFGKEHKVDTKLDYFRELPYDYPPAITGYLWRFGNVEVSDLTATLMDLARRGWLKITETKKEKQGFFGSKIEYDYELELLDEPKDKLQNFEAQMIAYFFRTIGNDKTVTMEEVKDYAKSHTTSFQGFMKKWKKSIKTAGKKNRFIEPTGTIMMSVNIFVGAAVAITGVVLLTEGMYGGIVSLVLGITQALFSGLFRRRTKEGAQQLSKWAAFRRFLLHFSNLKEAAPSSMIIWEHYLVYAVTLGVATQVIKQLKVVIPEATAAHYSGPVWFHSSRGMEGFGGLEGLQNSFTQMTNAASSAMSSGSGGGGGFSGGGGGGGGGGGSAG